MLKRFILLLGALILVITGSVNAQTVYIYIDKYGSTVISDHKMSEAGLSLKKSYTPVSPIRLLGPAHYDFATRRLDTRETKFDRTIFDLADIYKQDRALIKAIVQIESSFNPRALSPKGAQGLMQLMPATASSYNVDDAFDVRDNLRGGIAFFADLMRRYKNDVRLALAAYNAGETAVSRYQGIPPYPETQAYVKYVLQLHKNYQQIASTSS